MFSFIITEVSPSLSPCLNFSLASCMQLGINNEEMVMQPMSCLKGIQVGDLKVKDFSCNLRDL